MAFIMQMTRALVAQVGAAVRALHLGGFARQERTA